MKKILFVFSMLMVLACSKRDDNNPIDVIGENISVLIAPVQTNNNYKTSDKDHYIVRNDKVHLNKLFLFIGGSFSTPKNYSRVCDHAASLGLDAISLSYFNNVAAATLGASSDSLVFDHYRDEICFGNPSSDEVAVNSLNSINSRTIELLDYLDLEFPEQNWSQYLTASKTIDWTKVVVSGHSQGAGHAGYLGKKNLVDKVAMFSGPNDYSTFYSKPANWLEQVGSTPLQNHVSLLHSKDQVVPFDHQVANLRGLGLISSTESPTVVDDLKPPFDNANALSLNVTAISNHNSTVGSNSILPEIWTYMFLD